MGPRPADFETWPRDLQKTCARAELAIADSTAATQETARALNAWFAGRQGPTTTRSSNYARVRWRKYATTPSVNHLPHPPLRGDDHDAQD